MYTTTFGVFSFFGKNNTQTLLLFRNKGLKMLDYKINYIYISMYISVLLSTAEKVRAAIRIEIKNLTNLTSVHLKGA